MNLIDQLSSRKPAAVIVSGALWLASVVLGGLTVFAARVILIWAMALLIPQPTTKARLETTNVINLAQQCGTVVFGLILLGIIVYTSERFFREAGNPRLLRMLARIIAVECLIVLPVWWLVWR